MSGPLRWKLIGGFLVVFIAGLVVGSFLGAKQVRRHRLDLGHHETLATKVRTRMQSRLDLTPEQVEKTKPIFDATARQLEDIREDTGRRVQATFANADRHLVPELTEEQRARLEKLEAQHRTTSKEIAASEPQP